MMAAVVSAKPKKYVVFEMPYGHGKVVLNRACIVGFKTVNMASIACEVILDSGACVLLNGMYQGEAMKILEDFDAEVTA